MESIPTIEIDENGDLHTIYNDDINLYELGTVHDVRRASHIEFDQKNQQWKVIDAKTGDVVHTNKNRQNAIDFEIEYFQP